MKIEFQQGDSSPYIAEWGQGRWRIVKGPKEALASVEMAVGQTSQKYFRTSWDMADAVAKNLGGKMLEDPPGPIKNPSNVLEN